MTAGIVIGVAAVVVLLANIMVTRAVCKDAGISRLQKTAQIFLVWVLPGVGAIFIFHVVAYHHTREEMRSLVPFPFYMVAYRRPVEPENLTEIGGEGNV